MYSNQVRTKEQDIEHEINTAWLKVFCDNRKHLKMEGKYKKKFDLCWSTRRSDEQNKVEFLFQSTLKYNFKKTHR